MQLALLKGTEMVLNAFRNDLFPWKFCERILASESPIQILSEVLLSTHGKSNQNTTTKTSVAKIGDTQDGCSRGIA